MLVATNRKTDSGVCRHGCVGLCKSPDLYHWEYCQPIYSPLAYDGTYECPDLFQMGQWYYLVYSNANYNKMTHYVKSRSMYGPWETPSDDTIDSFLFYAGRTASDGKNRYIAAWNPERTGEDLAMKLGLRDVDQTPMFQFEDLAPLGYAGDMVIHKLGQRENGDLTCEPIAAVTETFTDSVPFAFHALQGAPWDVTDANVHTVSKGIYSCALAQTLPTRYSASLRLKVDGYEAGIVLGADESFYGKGLFLRIQVAKGRVNVLSGLRDKPYIGYCLPFAVEQEKAIQPDENGYYNVRILQDGELIALYINGSSLCLRSKNAVGGYLGFYAYDSEISISQIEVKTSNKEDTK